MDDIAGIDHAVVKGYEEGGRLEDRAGFAAVADGGIDGLDVLPLLVTHHVDDGLDVACLHFHDDGDAQLAVHLRALQHVKERALCEVLHVDVDGGYDVTAVDGQCHGNVHEFVQHLATSCDAWRATQDGVIPLLQPKIGGVGGHHRAADGALCQGAKGTTAGVVFFLVEATLVARHV